MPIADFKLERYFAAWEFTAPYSLCSSDIEGWRMADLLALADDAGRELWERLTLGYTTYPGHPLLRAEIAGLHSSIEADQILTFAGASEAIYAFMHAAVRPDDHIIAFWPGYQSLYEVARSIGAEVTLLPLRAEDGWALDVGALRAALRPNTRLIVLNTPHNPTGALLDRATLDAVVALAEEAGAYLFSDEVYRLMEHSAADRLPVAADLGAHVISLGVMSKAFGLAGLRVGWLALRDPALYARLSALKDYLSMCNSAPSEALALIALRARDAVLARGQAMMARNLPLLDAFFARWAGTLEWVRPRAGCVGFPRLLRPVPVEQFALDLVEQEGVLVLPESVYGSTGNHFRIGFGRTAMPEALARLERFLERQGFGA